LLASPRSLTRFSGYENARKLFGRNVASKNRFLNGETVAVQGERGVAVVVGPDDFDQVEI
jgi:hypothetical protein